VVLRSKRGGGPRALGVESHKGQCRVPRACWLWAFAALGVPLGCGADATIADGSVTDGSADAGLAVTPPNIPWLDRGVPPIMLAPCPDGWREVTVGDITECDAYPEDGPHACAAGEAHFPGEASCRMIGDPCPAGDYATTLPGAGTLVYVNSTAAAGGDGSLASPFAALSDVPWITLAAGTTVAVAKGTYEGTLPLRAGVHVVGACVSETVINGIAAPVMAVVSVTSAGDPAVVRNLTIARAPQMGAAAGAGRALSLTGVLIDGTRDLGIFASGAGANVLLTDVVVQDTQPRSGDGVGGRGIEVEGGARLDATRLIVRENRHVGVFVEDNPTVVVLADTVIRDTLPRANDDAFGRGIYVHRGARLEASRLLVVGNRDIGLFALDDLTEVVLTDAVVMDTQPQASDDALGQGIFAGDGVRLEASRLLVANNHDIGVTSSGEGTELSLTDAVIRDTQARASDGDVGQGLVAQQGARLQASRIFVTANREVGILAVGAGTELIVMDAAVRDTQSRQSDGGLGAGVVVQGGARLEASRFSVTRSHEVGILASDDGATVILRDAVVRDLTPIVSEAPRFGVIAQLGGRIEGVRVEVDAWKIGVSSLVSGYMDLRDVSIGPVDRVACGAGACTGGVAAIGASATLLLSRFQIREAATCGVLVAEFPGDIGTASVDLSEGVVSDSTIGACVQVDGYDVSRLNTDVEYRNNEQNLDSTMLVVPGVIGTVAP